MLAHRIDPMPQGWSTVFTGPPGEALVVRAKLEAHGFPVFVPGETMRLIGMLGDYGTELALDPAVQVPPSAAAPARACIEGRDEESAIRLDERELPADFFEPEPEPTVALELMKRTRTLSRCILWGAAFPLGAPFALWHLRPYLKSARLLGQRPPLHLTTIAAACLSPLNFCFGLIQIYAHLR